MGFVVGTLLGLSIGLCIALIFAVLIISTYGDPDEEEKGQNITP